MATVLKQILVEHGLYQYDVAARARVSETRMSRFATGRADPRPDEAKRIAATLSVPVEKVFPKVLAG